MFKLQYFSINLPPTLGKLMLELDRKLLECHVLHTGKCATITMLHGKEEEACTRGGSSGSKGGLPTVGRLFCIAAPAALVACQDET